MSEHQHLVYLSLGTNLGHREENIQSALQQLSLRVGTLERVSSVIETKPWGFQSENKFLNACCRIRTALSPMQLLQATQEIERSIGRTEKSKNGVYHDRLIDIDILYYDHLKLDTPELTIPHPHIKERDFVMVPLKEIIGNDNVLDF